MKISEARHFIIPAGTVTTGWPAVRDQLAEWGETFDPWQVEISRAALGKRETGIYSATIGGVVLSLPRQVGKTHLVSRLLFALCALFPGLRCVWTAHHGRTITNTFQNLQALARNPLVREHLTANGIRTANGQQEFVFKNGSRIMFGAREQGFGRGIDAVDIEVFDECQILTSRAAEDMIAATNQNRHPFGALLFFTGTPPKPSDPSEFFVAKRERALAGQDDVLYVEYSADPDADSDDRAQWSKANPTFPGRTPLDSMLRLRENLPEEDSWRREALGIWDATASPEVIDSQLWSLCADTKSVVTGPKALAVDVSPDRRITSVALAGMRDDGFWHVELVEQRAGVGWLPNWLIDTCQRNPEVSAVVIDAKSPAASLIPALQREGVRVTQTTTQQMVNACAGYFDAVEGLNLRHTDQPQVNFALKNARKRNVVGGGWAWNRLTASSDITPVVAQTLALWGAQNQEVVSRPTPQRRKVIVYA